MQMELVLFFGGCVLVNQMLVIENEKIAITLRLKKNSYNYNCQCCVQLLLVLLYPQTSQPQTLHKP